MIICSRRACCLKLLHAYRGMHPPDAAIRAARLSPRLEAAQHLPKRLSLPSSRLLGLPSAVPDRPLPATPVVGSLSSESTVQTLRWLRRLLTFAQTVPVWPTSRCSARLPSDPSPPSPLHCRCGTLPSESTALSHCSSSIATSALSNSLAVSYSKTQSLQL